MRFVSVICLCLSLASVAKADRDPDFESGLVSIPVEGSQVLPGPSYSRPQLITKDTTTRPTVGAIAAVAGTLSLGAGWIFYVARQNYRLTPRFELDGVVEHWETLGHWSLTLGGFGSANLIASEYLLLGESKSVPTLAIIGGVAGVVTAAIGAGFWIGAQSCAPVALRPGAEVPVGCFDGTADKAFGPLLVMSALPLINLPLVYVLRNVFRGPAESLTLGTGGLQYTGRF